MRAEEVSISLAAGRSIRRLRQIFPHDSPRHRFAERQIRAWAFAQICALSGHPIGPHELNYAFGLMRCSSDMRKPE